MPKPISSPASRAMLMRPLCILTEMKISPTQMPLCTPSLARQVRTRRNKPIAEFVGGHGVVGEIGTIEKIRESCQIPYSPVITAINT